MITLQENSGLHRDVIAEFELLIKTSLDKKVLSLVAYVYLHIFEEKLINDHPNFYSLMILYVDDFRK